MAALVVGHSGCTAGDSQLYRCVYHLRRIRPRRRNPQPAGAAFARHGWVDGRISGDDSLLLSVCHAYHPCLSVEPGCQPGQCGAHPWDVTGNESVEGGAAPCGHGYCRRWSAGRLVHPVGFRHPCDHAPGYIYPGDLCGVQRVWFEPGGHAVSATAGDRWPGAVSGIPRARKPGKARPSPDPVAEPRPAIFDRSPGFPSDSAGGGAAFGNFHCVVGERGQWRV